MMTRDAISTSVACLFALLCMACCAQTAPSPALPSAKPVRAVMLDPEGLVMAGYSNIPHLRAFGDAVGVDVDYWVINDEATPSVFLVSPHAVSAQFCIDINSAFVGADLLPQDRVCGLRQARQDGDCSYYVFDDPVYGHGVVAVTSVPLRWHLPFEDQARASDCLVGAILTFFEPGRIEPHALRILQDYVHPSTP